MCHGHPKSKITKLLNLFLSSQAHTVGNILCKVSEQYSIIYERYRRQGNGNESTKKNRKVQFKINNMKKLWKRMNAISTHNTNDKEIQLNSTGYDNDLNS